MSTSESDELENLDFEQEDNAARELLAREAIPMRDSIWRLILSLTNLAESLVFHVLDLVFYFMNFLNREYLFRSREYCARVRTHFINDFRVFYRAVDRIESLIVAAVGAFIYVIAFLLHHSSKFAGLLGQFQCGKFTVPIIVPDFNENFAVVILGLVGLFTILLSGVLAFCRFFCCGHWR